ncbi:MAG: hypothetical protein VXW65_15395 [Pseudomonadota bacterium]|nr:hypothetical protein [Pseudomonadota bacterium]
MNALKIARCGACLLLALQLTPSAVWASAAKTNDAQPKAQWYRTNPSGVPSISTTITEVHVRHGYDVLDRNMQVIRRVPAYIPEQYQRQKAQRERLEEQRQADRNLMSVHVSSVHAAAKRDAILTETQTRAQFLQKQLDDLQLELSKDIATAASYERRKQDIPFSIKQRLDTKREQVAQAERNVQAIHQRQTDIKTNYAKIIERLEYLERNRGALQAPTAQRQP